MTGFLYVQKDIKFVRQSAYIPETCGSLRISTLNVSFVLSFKCLVSPHNFSP
jgi:hypothetical protein